MVEWRASVSFLASHLSGVSSLKGSAKSPKPNTHANDGGEVEGSSTCCHTAPTNQFLHLISPHASCSLAALIYRSVLVTLSFFLPLEALLHLRSPQAPCGLRKMKTCLTHAWGCKSSGA